MEKQFPFPDRPATSYQLPATSSQLSALFCRLEAGCLEQLLVSLVALSCSSRFEA